MDDRAPVLVGVGAVTQSGETPSDSLDAFELMVRATELAGSDCGVPAALARVGLVLAPRGLWSYRDPGRVIAARFGASGAVSVVGEIGVLQQTLLSRAAQAIADGSVDTVLVVGAEAKYRALLAAKQGVELTDTDPSTGDPDEVIAPVGDIITRTEVERELAMPAHQYATIESAIAHVEHRSPPEQRAHVAELWARFAAAAVDNVDAWDRDGHSAAEIGTPGPGNRAIATPYTKLLCSQWNVDQSAALLLMAAETAAGLGIARDRWIYAHAGAESNQMVPLPCRTDIHRWPAFEAVADALGLTGPDAVVPSVREIYSCFPAAVQVQARALGIPLEEPLTVSGGMTFGGGPLNSAVLQSMVPFARRLRSEPEATGIITSVSGMITKPGASLWSASPPPEPFRSTDATQEAVARTGVRELLPNAVGPATIAAHTVVYDGPEPARAVVVLDVDGGRTVARTGDVDVARAMTDSDWVGRAVRVASPGAFVVD